MIQGVASNFLADLLSKFGSGVSDNFRKKHPSQLNHDLQRALEEAIQMSIENIRILYNETIDNKEEKKSVNQFSKTVIENIPFYFSAGIEEANSESELKLYLSTDLEEAKTKLLNLLQFEVSQHNLTNEYINFFESNILQQLQLCIAEKLKDSKHEKAWKAFRKMMLEDIKADTEKILEGQKKITEGIDDLKKQSTTEKLIALTPQDKEALTLLLKELNDPKKILVEFDKALQQQLTEINDSLRRIEHRQKEHYEISERTEKTIRKKLWGKPIVIVTAIAIASMTVAAAIRYYYIQQPFDITVVVHGPKGKDDIVLANRGAVIINYGNKPEKITLNAQGEAIFRQIPGKFKDDSTFIIVSDLAGDPYKPECNNCRYKLESGKTFYIKLEPYGLDKLYGRVKDERGKPVQDAIVLVQDLEVATDLNGFFVINIPVSKQRRFQNITVVKRGYQDESVPKVAPHTQTEPLEIQLKKN